MQKIFYWSLIYFQNFFIHPYFNNLSHIFSFWLWVIAFSAYFVVLVGLITAPVWWYYLRQSHKKTATIWQSLGSALLMSATSVTLITAQFFLFIHLMDQFYPMAREWDGKTILRFFFITETLTTTLLMYFPANFFHTRQIWKFNPLLLFISFLSAGLSIGSIFFVLWATAPSGLCSKSDDLYVSSGYRAHTNDLCWQRPDKSECPQTPEDLRAFRPQDYDQLQICYSPIKATHGYMLERRLLETDPF
ncbi:MAG TPA: hypothetical protein VD999_03265 [Vitreimonas sp.]|nr:hypothetical protein [Vitreimonas sp.]